MTQRSSRRLIPCLAFAIAVLQPVHAEPTPPSPAGEWTFVTGEMRNSCVLSGRMSVKRKADKSLICRFTADWSCKAGMMRSVQTTQTCTAKQTGHDVIVTSKIEKITRSDPAELMQYMRDNYAADHFKVKINTRGDEMRGLFHSYGQAEVIFRRNQELIG